MAWTNILHTPKKIVMDKLTWYEKQKPQKSLIDFEKKEETDENR